MVVVCRLVLVADGVERSNEFMVAVDEDNAGAVTIDMKLFGVNHDRYVLTMEAADDGVVQNGADWVRMEAEAIRFRNMVMVGENYLVWFMFSGGGRRRRAADWSDDGHQDGFSYWESSSSSRFHRW